MKERIRFFAWIAAIIAIWLSIVIGSYVRQHREQRRTQAAKLPVQAQPEQERPDAATEPEEVPVAEIESEVEFLQPEIRPDHATTAQRMAVLEKIRQEEDEEKRRKQNQTPINTFPPEQD